MKARRDAALLTSLSHGWVATNLKSPVSIGSGVVSLAQFWHPTGETVTSLRPTGTFQVGDVWMPLVPWMPRHGGSKSTLLWLYLE